MAASSLFSVKSLLLSAGVLAAALFLNLYLSSIVSFMVYRIPLFYEFLLSWMTPPYLYFIVNGIIITIAVSSRLKKKGEEATEQTAAASFPSEIRQVYEVSEEVVRITSDEIVRITSDEIEPVFQGADLVSAMEEEKKEEMNEFAISRFEYSVPGEDSAEISPELPLPSRDLTEYSFPAAVKPLSSARFGQRRNLKAHQEGSRLRGVSKSKRCETLESAWKIITDGRSMPLTRHLKKSETFSDLEERPSISDPTPDATFHVTKKSETFKQRKAAPSPSMNYPPVVKLRKEPSLSQDELNRRVEAFINKFNEDIRLQRQESLQQYMEMVKRGAHY